MTESCRISPLSRYIGGRVTQKKDKRSNHSHPPACTAESRISSRGESIVAQPNTLVARMSFVLAFGSSDKIYGGTRSSTSEAALIRENPRYQLEEHRTFPR